MWREHHLSSIVPRTSSSNRNRLSIGGRRRSASHPLTDPCNFRGNVCARGRNVPSRIFAKVGSTDSPGSAAQDEKLSIWNQRRFLLGKQASHGIIWCFVAGRCRLGTPQNSPHFDQSPLVVGAENPDVSGSHCAAHSRCNRHGSNDTVERSSCRCRYTIPNELEISRTGTHPREIKLRLNSER